MKLKIVRNIFTSKSSTGRLFIDDVFFCFTLEDTARPLGVKIYGDTCIPALNNYSVTLSWSPRFKCLMPLIYNTPSLSVEDGYSVKFEGIRIHSGNYPRNTLGCVLVGDSLGVDFVGNSRKTYNKLMEVLKDIDIVDLEIINDQE
jgi:hypothetical protein